MFRIIRIIFYFRLMGNCLALDPEIVEFEDHVFYGLISLCLILFSGFCSGATQGLLSLDQITIEVKKIYGTEQEQKMGITQIIVGISYFTCNRRASFIIINFIGCKFIGERITSNFFKKKYR
ncbi:unnamed protein product [Paramecium sonneborni]|uniref:Uncharacterized protein n=1 Tax=Paramecium sonneborni TaxID=65129 RepID=A0A8S1K9V2_9CILI|nr:unnamed protein product [Paramecium sonneborni]